METVTDFIFLGSKINADGDYSHEIKKMLAPLKKTMTNLDSILKSSDITSPTKVQIKNQPASAGVRSLIWEDPTVHRATKPVGHSY